MKLLISLAAAKRDPMRYQWFTYLGRPAKFDIVAMDKEEYDLTLKKGEIFGVRKIKDKFYFVDKSDMVMQYKLQPFDANRLIKNSKGYHGKVLRKTVKPGHGGKDAAPRARGAARKEIKVDSSMMSRAVYEVKEKLLYVIFRNGAVWQYEDVTAEEAISFERSSSQGRWFNNNIKGVKESTRIEKL